MTKTEKKLREEVAAVQKNMSDADKANQAAILYLFDEVARLKEQLQALKKKPPKK